jgi:hypothetical protein
LHIPFHAVINNEPILSVRSVQVAGDRIPLVAQLLMSNAVWIPCFAFCQLWIKVLQITSDRCHRILAPLKWDSFSLIVAAVPSRPPPMSVTSPVWSRRSGTPEVPRLGRTGFTSLSRQPSSDTQDTHTHPCRISHAASRSSPGGVAPKSSH